MAAEGKISTFLCLITCSLVLFKNSKCSASVFFQNGGKRSGSRCFEAKKTFFSLIVGLAEEKNEHFDRTEKIKLCFVTNALEPPALKANLFDKGKG